jgi:hypothetical protein
MLNGLAAACWPASMAAAATPANQWRNGALCIGRPLRCQPLFERRLSSFAAAQVKRRQRRTKTTPGVGGIPSSSDHAMNVIPLLEKRVACHVAHSKPTGSARRKAFTVTQTETTQMGFVE